MSENIKKKSSTLYKLLNAIVILVVIVGLVWGVSKFFHLSDDNFTNSAQVDGYVNPINSRISGYVKEIRFTEHQKVKKGDTIAILDDREIRTQVMQAQAAYENALAVKKSTMSSVQTAENTINVTESSIEGARVRMENAYHDFQRYQALLNDEAVTRQQFDRAKTEYEALKATYEQLSRTKTSNSLSVNEVESKIGVNDAEIERAKAALDMAKINLSYTVITAPYDAIMGRRIINEGQLIQAGQQIATLVDDKNIWVTANYLEKQMPKIEIGEVVNITVDALGGKVLEGRVTAVSGATGSKYAAVPVDNSTGNFVKVQQRIPVRIEFTKNNNQNDMRRLRAGMNVEVSLKK